MIAHHNRPTRPRPAPALALLLLGSLCVILPAPSTEAAPSPTSVPGITEPFLDLSLSSPVPGIVTARNFDEGDRVEAGQPILELDRRLEELEQHRRQLVMDTLSQDLETTRELFKKTTAVSKEEVDKKQLEYDIAVAEFNVAAEQLSRRFLRAPVSGELAEITLDIGEACQPYEKLVRLVDTSKCYFVANVEARAAATLKLDQNVVVKLATGADELEVPATLVFLSPVADPASGLLRVKALFDNSTYQLRPGLAGRLIFHTHAD